MSRKDTVFNAELYQFSEIIVSNLHSIKGISTLSFTKYVDVMPVSDADFLQKILQAVGVSITQSLCINITQLSYSFAKFKQQYTPQYAICFGIAPSDLGLHLQIPLYQTVVLGGTSFLFADSLTLIASDKQKKAALWNTLKVMYRV